MALVASATLKHMNAWASAHFRMPKAWWMGPKLKNGWWPQSLHSVDATARNRTFLPQFQPKTAAHREGLMLNNNTSRARPKTEKEHPMQPNSHVFGWKRQPAVCLVYFMCMRPGPDKSSPKRLPLWPRHLEILLSRALFGGWHDARGWELQGGHMLLETLGIQLLIRDWNQVSCVAGFANEEGVLALGRKPFQQLLSRTGGILPHALPTNVSQNFHLLHRLTDLKMINRTYKGNI